MKHLMENWRKFVSEVKVTVGKVKDYVLRLTSMDNNYYDYFVVGESGEYSNALLNYPTTKGRSVGLEGGFGLFGSIASDWKIVKIIRR